jgi:hypothetical protein
MAPMMIGRSLKEGGFGNTRVRSIHLSKPLNSVRGNDICDAVLKPRERGTLVAGIASGRRA